MDEFGSFKPHGMDLQYHVVFIPKCRRRALYQELRRHLGEVFRTLARYVLPTRVTLRS